MFSIFSAFISVSNLHVPYAANITVHDIKDIAFFGAALLGAFLCICFVDSSETIRQTIIKYRRQLVPFISFLLLLLAVGFVIEINEYKHEIIKNKQINAAIEDRKPLIEIATRLLPVMEQQAMDFAQSFTRTSRPPELKMTSQYIEYPSIQLLFYCTPWSDYKLIEKPMTHDDSIANFSMGKYVEGGKGCKLETLTDKPGDFAEGDDPWPRYDPIYIDGPDSVLLGPPGFGNLFPDNERDNYLITKPVDLRQVKTIIIVLFYTSEIASYEHSEHEIYDNGWRRIESTGITYLNQVIVVNKESMAVTAYKSFTPDERLPFSAGFTPGSGINERTKAAREAWLRSLRSIQSK